MFKYVTACACESARYFPVLKQYLSTCIKNDHNKCQPNLSSVNCYSYVVFNKLMEPVQSHFFMFGNE